MNKIIHGDSLNLLPMLPKARLVFADPPDNIGAKYEGYQDCKHPMQYISWLYRLVLVGFARSDIFILSYNAKYQAAVFNFIYRQVVGVKSGPWQWRQFIWHFTFSQHNTHDLTSSYRPILRLHKPGVVFYPDQVREPSARQTVYNDKRANPDGRVPDDVLTIPRVCGTHKERRPWHPTQHPEKLMALLVSLCCRPGDLVIDMFSGTGTTNKVYKSLNINCIGIDVSRVYCKRSCKALKLPLYVLKGGRFVKEKTSGKKKNRSR